MKKNCLLLVVFASIFIFGCSDDIFQSTNTVGNTTMTLKFDLLKYLDPSQQLIRYGDDPVIPGDLGSYEIQSPVQSLDISSELEDINSVESVEMLITIEFNNETGIVDITYNAYIASLDVDPLLTPPIISEAVTLSGSEVVTSEVEVLSDERLIELFNEGVMQYLAQVLFEISEGSDNVSGVAEVVGFDITVVTTL